MGLAPEDLSKHAYILGGTGSGKTTLIRNLYKHLECVNYTNTLACSAIYIDVKDEDAILFLRQCERDSFDGDKVTYLDINHMDFTINLLELPRYQESDRDAVVSRMVGHIIEMFREFYSQQTTFVQMERILRLLLFYLYSNTDNPTMLDLYEIIVRLQTDGKTEMQQILQIYNKVTGPEMKRALDSISRLTKESWTPLLNRLEMFATDAYLRKKFSAKHTTIDFEKMFDPANITIFRISDAETPRYAHGMAIMAIVIKIWFMIQNRASNVDPQKRTLVVLTLDEFQKIRDLSVITSILSQARSYNLGLILSHQNISQIEAELLEIVVGNTSTQIYGRVSGIDAGKVARIIDPHFAKELTSQIATQPDFVFTAKSRPPQGQPQGLPIQCKAYPPPPLVLNETETLEFIQKMKNRYKSSEIALATLNSEQGKRFDWMKQLYTKFRTKEEWEIIKFLQKKNGNLKAIVEGVKSYARDDTSELIDELRMEGVIRVAKSRKRGYQLERIFTLSFNARNLYFPERFNLIGNAVDIDEISKKAFAYYLDKGYFVSLATQAIKNARRMCDMVAYDYQNDSAISVEIESSAEVDSHPEQVRLNMIKWKDLGFVQCHVWSKSKKISEIKDRLGKEAEKVQLFIV
jgi:hypothetical protein